MLANFSIIHKISLFFDLTKNVVFLLLFDNIFYDDNPIIMIYKVLFYFSTNLLNFVPFSIEKNHEILFGNQKIRYLEMNEVVLY